jgi:hypothetical protein
MTPLVAVEKGRWPGKRPGCCEGQLAGGDFGFVSATFVVGDEVFRV